MRTHATAHVHQPWCKSQKHSATQWLTRIASLQGPATRLWSAADSAAMEYPIRKKTHTAALRAQADLRAVHWCSYYQRMSVESPTIRFWGFPVLPWKIDLAPRSGQTVHETDAVGRALLLLQHRYDSEVVSILALRSASGDHVGWSALWEAQVEYFEQPEDSSATPIPPWTRTWKAYIEGNKPFVHRVVISYRMLSFICFSRKVTSPSVRCQRNAEFPAHYPQSPIIETTKNHHTVT